MALRRRRLPVPLQAVPGPVSAAADRLAARAVDVLPPGELARKLARGTPLRVKLGVDPTAPDIHLGHTVVLGKLREFQDAGHTAVLIIGDWTARVGDPSGRASTRPVLSAEDIERNADTYRDQAFRILDPERTEIRRNGEWFEGMGLEEVFALAGRATVTSCCGATTSPSGSATTARSRCSSCSTRSCRPTTRCSCAPTSRSAAPTSSST